MLQKIFVCLFLGSLDLARATAGDDSSGHSLDKVKSLLGGTEIKQKDAPWFVSIVTNGHLEDVKEWRIRSGAILGEKTILMHFDSEYRIDRGFALYGIHEGEAPELRRFFEPDLLPHPHFPVALVKLSEPMVLEPGFAEAAPVLGEIPLENDEVFLSGVDAINKVLLGANVSLTHVGDDGYLTFGTAEVSPCIRDTGGPVICNYNNPRTRQMCGVVTKAKCGLGSEAVGTHMIMEWIDKNSN